MPTIIANFHDNFIKRLIRTGEEKIMRRYRNAFLKNKKGYIYPIKLYLNYYWNIHDDFAVAALILK